jgi:MoaA/NifB/PqqE/SkfB family radical SAM enzyme
MAKPLLTRARDLAHYAGIALGTYAPAGGRALSGPIHAQIGICDPCNHRCVMCWDHPPDDLASESTADRFGGQAQELMSLETFKATIEDLAALGTTRVDLVGRGEPLLNRAVTDMVAFAKARKMTVMVCSNASRLTEPVARAFVDAGLDRFNVSLNAGTEETYPRIHVTETPEDFRRVLDNLARLASIRRAAGAAVPHMRLSFVVGARNHHELRQMVEVAARVGAQEAYFVHTVVHDGNRELALEPAEYDRLREAIPAVEDLAGRLGVQTNLRTFAATVPTYLDARVEGPAVVPCYVGWYFTNVLANGSVMPCCQCAKPLDRIAPDRPFREIWHSEGYRRFRSAARRLPEPDEALSSCECDRCMLRPRNVSIHNLLHPLNRIDIGEEDQLFRISDLIRLRKVDD